MNLLSLFGRGAQRPVPVPERGTVLAEAEEVTVEVAGKRLLDRVSLSVHAGEVLVLVGPNGAGKSTLLAALAGDRRPSAGQVRVAGRPVPEWSTVELAQRRSVLPQQNPLSFPFEVLAVVRMGRAPWEGTEAELEDDAVVEAALAATELGAFRHRRYPSLSGGEQARAALARVLAQAAPLLLLDEPTASLDLRHQEEVLKLARTRAAEGDGVLLVLHDLGLAAAFADRMAVLADGELAAVGPPEQVCTEDLLGEVYRYPVEVITHPRTGKPVALPVRD
ncbi:heme ABC transporter ATP-binding protein [Amycolatopsis nigrescens]|uniref:heme ABC transporter ATP-binding protein n=1 Tax=Amycolatopsis nigrescens TaxID=381445 RepID=UPI0003819AD5|nr:heme ABC transporter ATP-binding protein [Amycolatopsis nigrescens]